MAKRQSKDVETTFKKKFKSKKKIEPIAEVKRCTRNGDNVTIGDKNLQKGQTELTKLDHNDSALRHMFGKQVEREEMDMILSQAEPVYEVGWKNLSPGHPQGFNSQNTADIADIVKNLMTDEELLHPPSTPPLLNVWLEDRNEDTSVKKKGLPNARAHGKRSRTFGKKLTCDSKQLLEKLALAINASRDVEENLKENSEESNRFAEKCVSDKQIQKSSEENEGLKKDGSFDLFETQPAAIDTNVESDVTPPAVNTTKLVTVVESHPNVCKEEVKPEYKEEEMDISNEDLWSDDDFLNDSLVLKATQDPPNIISIFSPKMIKRKHCTSTPDNCMKKNGRYAFSLSPVTHNAATKANGTGQSKDVFIQRTAAHTNLSKDVNQSLPQKNKFGRNLINPPCVPLFQESTKVDTNKGPDKYIFSSSTSSNCLTKSNSNLQRGAIGVLSKPLESISVKNMKPSVKEHPNSWNTKTPTATKTSCTNLKKTAYTKGIQSVSHTALTSEQGLKDTSLSEDLLASLAEPDEWLDSQVCAIEPDKRPLPFSCTKNPRTDNTKRTSNPMVPQIYKMPTDKQNSRVSTTNAVHLNDTPTFEDSDEDLNENELLEVLDAIETQISNSQKQSSQEGSQPSSQSTADGTCSQKYTAQEIERKKREALKRRTDRLKSSQITSTKEISSQIN